MRVTYDTILISNVAISCSSNLPINATLPDCFWSAPKQCSLHGAVDVNIAPGVLEILYSRCWQGQHSSGGSIDPQTNCSWSKIRRSERLRCSNKSHKGHFEWLWAHLLVELKLVAHSEKAPKPMRVTYATILISNVAISCSSNLPINATLPDSFWSATKQCSLHGSVDVNIAPGVLEILYSRCWQGQHSSGGSIVPQTNYSWRQIRTPEAKIKAIQRNQTIQMLQLCWLDLLQRFAHWKRALRLALS